MESTTPIYFLRTSSVGGGGGYAARLFLLFSFPCSADHERDYWTSRSTRERNGWILLARKIKARTAEGRWMRNPVGRSSCVTPGGTSNELDVQNKWEEKQTNKKQTEILESWEKLAQRDSNLVLPSTPE